FDEVKSGREHLQRLSRRLVELQEAERSEIARELHDEIGQLLTGLKLLLESDRKLKLAPARSDASPSPGKLAPARSDASPSPGKLAPARSDATEGRFLRFLRRARQA